MTSKPRIPPGLGTAGAALWRSVWKVYDNLDPRERALLGHACRQTDTVAALEVMLKSDGMIMEGSQGQVRLSSVVAELRNSRLAVSRLLADLDLPALGAGTPRTTGNTRRRRNKIGT